MDENDFCKVVHKTHFCIQSMPVKSRDKGRGLQFSIRTGGASAVRGSSVPQGIPAGRGEVD